MKCYYVMIKFGGPYVTGFVVPQAKDEAHALKQLRVLIWARYKISKDDYPSNDFSTSKLKEFMRSLKRPWRLNGSYRSKGQKKAVYRESGEKVVIIQEMTLPALSGYWLSDLVTGKHLCNMRYTLPAEG